MVILEPWAVYLVVLSETISGRLVCVLAVLTGASAWLRFVVVTDERANAHLQWSTLWKGCFTMVAKVWYGQAYPAHNNPGWISLKAQRWGDGILRVIVMPFIHNHFMLQHNNAKPYAARICTLPMQMVVTPDTDSPAPFMWETKGTPVRWSNTDFLSKREKLYFYFDALRFLSLMFCFHDSVCDDSKLLINLSVLSDSEWILILIRTLHMSDMTALEMLPMDSKPGFMTAKRRFKTS